MPFSVEFLNLAMGLTPGMNPTWGELMSDLWPLISTPLSAEGERILLRILQFDGRLRLEVTSDLPHSMTPEEMLKSLSIQALTKWTGLTYLSPIQRIELLTPSAPLQFTARAAIQQARSTIPSVPRIEAVSESEPAVDLDQDFGWKAEWSSGSVTAKAKLVPVEHFVGNNGGWTFIRSRQSRSSRSHKSHEQKEAVWTEML